MKQRGTKAYIHCFLSKPGTASSGPAPAPPSSSRRRPLTVTADLARSTSRHTRRRAPPQNAPAGSAPRQCSAMSTSAGQRRCCWASSLSGIPFGFGGWKLGTYCHQGSSSSPSSKPDWSLLIRQSNKAWWRRGKKPIISRD